MAQTLTVLHSFGSAPGPSFTNADGADVNTGLIFSGSTLYGVADQGGSSGYGTLFKVNTNGTGFTNLHSFAGGPEGSSPEGDLILSGNTLYGTADNGGNFGGGVIFAIGTNGTGLTNIHNFSALSGFSPFTNSDGAVPTAGLLLSGTTLYGTAKRGGSSGNGTVFRVNTDGTGFTNLHNFTGTDGSEAVKRLVLSGNALYGSAELGGSMGSGTLFRLKTDGTGFTNLYAFSAKHTNSSGIFTNSDGANPAGLILSGNTLYGTAVGGGASGIGTIFAINTNGSGFTNLHDFDGYGFDGAFPQSLVQSGNSLYGVASGGLSGAVTFFGTLFAIQADGSGFDVLYYFSPTGPISSYGNGKGPDSPMIIAGNNLYGTTYSGGSGGSGTVFSLLLQPQLNIACSGTNAILSWPAYYNGYTLQSATNLSPVSSSNWSNVNNGPSVIKGHYTVTNAILGSPKFYRLIQ